MARPRGIYLRSLGNEKPQFFISLASLDNKDTTKNAFSLGCDTGVRIFPFFRDFVTITYEPTNMPSNTTPHNNALHCVRGSAHYVRFAFLNNFKAKPGSGPEVLLLG